MDRSGTMQRFCHPPEEQWNNERIARQLLGDRRETLAPRAADLHVVWVAENPILKATGDRVSSDRKVSE